MSVLHDGRFAWSSLNIFETSISNNVIVELVLLLQKRNGTVADSLSRLAAVDGPLRIQSRVRSLVAWQHSTAYCAARYHSVRTPDGELRADPQWPCR